MDRQRPQQTPAADSQHVFLPQPQIGPSAVEFTGDSTILRNICGIVRVEKKKPGLPNLHFPCPNPEIDSLETE